MSVIDQHGRLFGRVNLIDALVALFVLGLIPLAYGTALLFQPARPRIDSVTRVDITNEERRIIAGGSLLAAKLKIKGTGFHPMLRASVGGAPARRRHWRSPPSPSWSSPRSRRSAAAPWAASPAWPERTRGTCLPSAMPTSCWTMGFT